MDFPIVGERREPPETRTITSGAAPPARTLLDIFAETVIRRARCVAIDTPDRVLSYADLWAAVEGLAGRLRDDGIGPGDRVGVRIRSGSSELYVAVLAVLHAGAAYVPVDADDPPARAREIWAAAEVCAVVGDELAVDVTSVPRGAGRRVCIDDEAWVIFTSGSTGRPKGVAVTHRSAAAFVDSEADLWEIRPQDRVLAGLSVGFDASCEEMWLAWRHGAALVPAPRSIVRSGAALGPWLHERGVTVVSTVPTLAAMWNEDEIGCVRLLILGGEPCPEALAWRLAERREVWNTYGPTEATVVSTAARVRPGTPVTIGWPLNGWEVVIVDERGEPVGIGESGELVIAGVGLGRYLDPALDAERYAPLEALGWTRAYRTGDVVAETVGGLRFVGRRDDQIKLGGRRIELGDIEAHLRSVPRVSAAAAALRHSDAGTPLLVGYVVGDVDATTARAHLAQRLPAGVVPLVVVLGSLPLTSAGKLDRAALPWPPPSPSDNRSEPNADESLTDTEAWLREQWRAQLGPALISRDSDFFELGGSSLSAAKLVSELRERYPSLAIVDLYADRRLRDLAARLDRLGSSDADAPPATRNLGSMRRWTTARLAAFSTLLAVSTPPWLLALFVFDRWRGTGPQLPLGWLIAGGLIFATPFGRASLVLLARRALLVKLEPGRYPRRSWLTLRLWVVERTADAMRSERLAGTPFAARYARLCGHRVGAGARLGTLPPVAGLVSIGARVTLEGEIDTAGWWLEGDELVIGEVRIGDGARVGTRALLGPGSDIGAGAEIEAGSVVQGVVPAGERWGGVPARRVGRAGEQWPHEAAPVPRRARLWRAMYGFGLALESAVPLVAALPALAILVRMNALDGGIPGPAAVALAAPVMAASYTLGYALVVAGLVRLIGRMLHPGWHADHGGAAWALWMTDALTGGARDVLFPMFASLYVRPWLRLAGVPVGRGAEISTVVGLSRLTSFAPGSFAADDVVLATGRARDGWLHVAPIHIGERTFLGNGALLHGGTMLGPGGLIGVLTTAPDRVAAGTSWLGSPPIELQRSPDSVDPRRTTDPPLALVIARAATEIVRIILPATVSIVLAAAVLSGLELLFRVAGTAVMVAATPLVLLAAGIVATTITIGVKWVLMGRYRAGEHPLWSWFVWRDEIINSLQDELAGSWLLGIALATPLMSVYLRAMGAKVGCDVWCDSLTITEFDMVELGAGCVVNRFACVETHLFHDRLMRIGPTKLGAGSSIGPSSAVLPDTVLGACAWVGGRSVVLRGEQLPPATRWCGAPVTRA